MRPLLILAMAILAAACSSTSADEEINKEFNEIMQKHNAVGLCVAAVKDGKIVYNNTFGYKDLEQQIPIADDDVLRIASISKSFTATAILQLVEQGKLNLDTDISAIQTATSHLTI